MLIIPGLLLPLIPLEILLSTKGLMFLLLSAYGGAMWTFLSGAPRVHTLMVPDLDRAKKFYEEQLKLPEAELPLQYYYGYEQNMMGSAFDSVYFQGDIAGARRYDYSPRASSTVVENPGLWYQLSDNAQLHIIGGSPGQPDASLQSTGIPTYSTSQSGALPERFRHTSFDRDTVKAVLKVVIKKKISHSVRSEKPLIFWVKDTAGQIVEFAEVVA